tara:strand:- start:1788 stop:2123 length:336 start_codon:yes stop_codon:yes gene_type:complete
MKHKNMVELMDNIHSHIVGTHINGQKEYARDEDNVFANFERIANDMNLTKELVLWIYLYKHIDGIKAHIQGHTSQREDVRGRITDAIVYLNILWAMIDNDENVDILSRGKK